jgi:hypothetical protein
MKMEMSMGMKLRSEQNSHLRKLKQTKIKRNKPDSKKLGFKARKDIAS